MNIQTAFSEKKSIEEVVADIKKTFGDFDAKMVIFFASSVFDPAGLSQKMQETFSFCPVFGCTTAGEIAGGRLLNNSVVAMVFNSEVIADVNVEVVEHIREDISVHGALSSFADYYKVPMSEMDFKQYVGIILVDGLCGSEEKLMEKIGDLTNVIFVGGSAGDDLQFSRTHIFAHGKSFSNAAVLALLKPKAGFDIIKTQSFRVLDKNFVATKANEAEREVLEFNNKPASLCYAEAIGKPVAEAQNYFMHNPLGLVIDGEPYVRSPQQINGDKMIFYSNVLEGMEVSLLESTDIVKDTKQAIEDKKKECGSLSGMINFHCILRTLELQKKGQLEDYGKIFADTPTIGFSTYGEEYMGHVNQTSTILVFK